MMQKQTRSDFSALPVGLALGAGGSMTLTVLLCGLLAYLINKETVAEGSIQMCAVAVLILSAGSGALLAFRKVGHHRMAVCLAAGAVYYLVLLGCAALFFSEGFQAVGVTALAVLGGSGAAALLGLREGRRGSNRRHRK